ncbi:MAG: class I SAM-dependent RNA methyltransferase [Oscillospiraceae bacterium]|nr:class I SAM-dependent RNA methyltransferase [Oscillospiraceae bacterium]
MENRTHIVTITDYSSQGEGVARLDNGRVVFVRGAARGDACQIAIISEQSRSCRGEIVDVIEASKQRIEPDCPVYPKCGGCDFRHITYEEELNAKLMRVNSALERIGGVSLRANEILATGRVDGYRNKAVFHTSGQGDNIEIGFYGASSHDLIPIRHCLLLEDDLNIALEKLCDTRLKAGENITLRAGNMMGEDQFEVELDGLIFEASMVSFFQVNSEAALLLFQRAREYASLAKNEMLVDLYCGVGSLTLFIGRDAGSALGVENNASAVDNARANAMRNGFEHIDFLCADAAKWDATGINPDCVIVDPPRSGLSSKAVEKMHELSPERIIYVSCDPATLARDVIRLSNYEAIAISAIDMFPRTSNIECCLLLVRKKSI